MKTHHTPSPWHIGKRYPSGAIYDEKGGEICAFSNLLHPAEVAANARLIAAAPDLFILAKDFLRLMEDHKTRATVDATLLGAFDYYAKNARAALAKAEGTQ
jgi:hypothetical protein